MLHPPKKKGLYYATFNTDIGWIGILGSDRGLLSITLPQPSSEQAHRLLGNCANSATHSPDHFRDLIKRLVAYFSGQKTTFPDELDLSQATPFQCQIWQAAKLIPYGQTKSYAWIAEQIGRQKAVHAVGQALSRNPLHIIIPCHRVLNSDGKLGGYSGGVELKRYLLQLEAQASSR